MDGLTVIMGFGAVGRALTEALLARGDQVRVVQRSRPSDLASRTEFIGCDVGDLQAVRRGVDGARQVVLAIGFPYDSRVWRAAWPKAMTNVVEACAETGARVVFIDNLYQLGPQTRPRREDMALSDHGEKAAILAEVTRIWLAAKARVKFAALRCPDFYGPGVTISHLGSSGFGQLALGKPAMLLAPPDIPHDFAYVPDIARAAVTLLEAPDDAYGEIWNMPCAPSQTPRQILALGAAALEIPLKIIAIPLWLLPLMGLFSRFMKEVADVGYTWDRPYVVDSDKFKRRFWQDVTPYEVGAPATARSFKALVGGASKAI